MDFAHGPNLPSEFGILAQLLGKIKKTESGGNRRMLERGTE